MLNGKRVLVAHPDPIYRGAVAAVLAQAGASTIIATTIDEALGQFRSLNRQVDLVLTAAELQGESARRLIHGLFYHSGGGGIPAYFFLSAEGAEPPADLDDVERPFVLPETLAFSELLVRIERRLRPVLVAVGRHSDEEAKMHFYLFCAGHQVRWLLEDVPPADVTNFGAAVLWDTLYGGTPGRQLFQQLQEQAPAMALTLITTDAPKADDEVSFSDWRTHLLPRLAAA